nr:MAG TPA: hypothetical protein [Caudoviricetes sp.]
MVIKAIGYHRSLRKYPIARPSARARSTIATHMSMSTP